ncbi:hypothetical protein ABID21_001698 [Pseudorhizobium tarimense]|uniref:DUF4189 domain-containing protein n=1 Tax=Pseudorhizobium tarimense TaxID=1079109 RepID=A0ABV2H4Z7_9HYPH|nr:hypothetical protein [Pseudorhizobium tarimense]MCJ8518808.1 hypothetical protein [Pseudorhizobium tarimense]
MNHFLKLIVVAALAGAVPVTAAVGQAAFDANEDPAEIYGYGVDVTEADDSEKTERALKA